MLAIEVEPYGLSYILILTFEVIIWSTLTQLKPIENKHVHLKTQLIFGFDIQLGHCFIPRDEKDQEFIFSNDVDPLWSFIFNLVTVSFYFHSSSILKF